MSRYKGNDDGGFGNPPVSHQFQKGNPGGGRPKGSNSMAGALKKVFRGDSSYLVNGEPKTSKATEALALRALQLGLSGSQKANEAARSLAEKYGPPVEHEAVSVVGADLDLGLLDDVDMRVLGILLRKAIGDTDVEGYRYEPLDHPLAYWLDPLDERNYYFHQTVDGLHYRRSTMNGGMDQLLSMTNRAYISAALPLKPGCYRR